MSKSAPDFSSSFALVGNQLTETEQRLRRHRKHQPEQDGDSEVNLTDLHSTQNQTDLNNLQTQALSKPRFDTRTREGDWPASSERIPRQPERRRNLTLKVLESNEAEFNRLFHRLQLSGEPRRKQDLADEALQLLFETYRDASS